MDASVVAQLWQALSQHQYVVFAALVIGMSISLLKQGYLSAWLAQKVPSAMLPVVAAAMGVVGMVAQALATGQDWRQAVFAGLAAAFTAVFGHQVVVEGMMGGSEIVQPAPWMKTPSVAPDPPKAA